MQKKNRPLSSSLSKNHSLGRTPPATPRHSGKGNWNRIWGFLSSFGRLCYQLSLTQEVGCFLFPAGARWVFYNFIFLPTTYANGWTEKLSNSQPSNKSPDRTRVFCLGTIITFLSKFNMHWVPGFVK